MNLNQAGLSILEILVAATILSFISIAVVEITDNSTQTKDRILTEDKEFMRLENAFNRIGADISLLYTPLYFSPINSDMGGYAGNEQFEFATKMGHPIPQMRNEERSRFEFMVFNHRRVWTDSKQCQYAWVRYALKTHEKRDEEGTSGRESESGNGSVADNFDLVRSYVPENIYLPERINWDEVQAHVVLSNVKKLEFSFWSEKGKKFVEKLTDLKESDKVRAVKVLIVYYDPAGQEVEDERIFRSIWPEMGEDKDEKNSASVTPTQPRF